MILYWYAVVEEITTTCIYKRSEAILRNESTFGFDSKTNRMASGGNLSLIQDSSDEDSDEEKASMMLNRNKKSNAGL